MRVEEKEEKMAVRAEGRRNKIAEREMRVMTAKRRGVTKIEGQMSDQCRIGIILAGEPGGEKKGEQKKFWEMKQTKWNNVKQEKGHKLTSRLTKW